MVDFSEQPPTIITINQKGEYFINALDNVDIATEVTKGEKLPLGVIAGRVKARLDFAPNTQVFVRGDREVAYGSVVALMSFLQSHGVEKVGIVTESANAK